MTSFVRRDAAAAASHNCNSVYAGVPPDHDADIDTDTDEDAVLGRQILVGPRNHALGYIWAPPGEYD